MSTVNQSTSEIPEVNRARGFSDPVKFTYRFDAGLTNTEQLEGKQVATQNHRGVQMSTVSPLFKVWVANYKPGTFLADLGTAYGINMLNAINNYDIKDALAIDMTQEHLDYVAKHHEKHSKNKSTNLRFALGKLPELENVEDGTISSLLVAEVIHFLTPDEVRLAFKRFHDVLCEGGAVVITCVSTKAMTKTNPEYARQIEKQKRNGVEFYGYINKEDFTAVLETLCNNNGDSLNEASMPDLLHAFDCSLLSKLAEEAGFVVEQIGMTSHPGYPAIAKGPYANLQAVFRKV